MDTSCMATVITCQRIGRNHQQHDHHDQPGPMATKELMMCAARLLPIVVERDPYVMPRHAAQQKQRAKHDNRRVRSDHNASPMSFTAYAWKKALVLHDHLEQAVHTPARGKTVVDSRAHAPQGDKRAHKDVYRCDKTKAAPWSQPPATAMENNDPMGPKMLAIPTWFKDHAAKIATMTDMLRFTRNAMPPVVRTLP